MTRKRATFTNYAPVWLRSVIICDAPHVQIVFAGFFTYGQTRSPDAFHPLAAFLASICRFVRREKRGRGHFQSISLSRALVVTLRRGNDRRKRHRAHQEIDVSAMWSDSRLGNPFTTASAFSEISVPDKSRPRKLGMACNFHTASSLMVLPDTSSHSKY